MTSKEAILSSVRSHRPAACELPNLHHAWTTYPDARAQFIDVFTAVGGSVIVVRDRIELNEKLGKLPVYADASRIASLVAGLGEPNVDFAAVESPHALADVDVAILPGEFAVAENGAVWVTDRDVPLRVLYFLCQHLVLVVAGHEIVDHMHAAYERLAAGPASRAGRAPDHSLKGTEGEDVPVPLGSRHLHAFAGPGFGAFISGPSKTADIEQSLVIGAHGPRSLTVFLLVAR